VFVRFVSLLGTPCRALLVFFIPLSLVLVVTAQVFVTRGEESESIEGSLNRLGGIQVGTQGVASFFQEEVRTCSQTLVLHSRRTRERQTDRKSNNMY
jgi:hypothetical protein